MNPSPTDPGKPRETVQYRHQRVSVELPTLLVAVIVYGGWLALTAAYDHWPLWIVVPAVVVLLDSAQFPTARNHSRPSDPLELDQPAHGYGAAVFLAAV